MVGMLGCGCCGPTRDNPTYYGRCDCGTDSQVLRGDYLEPFNEPVPDLPIFYRPGGFAPNTNPHTDWIYSGRFHLTCKPTWNNVHAAPYWSGYQDPNLSDISKPYGIAGVYGQYNSKESKYKVQFVFNEFDYEYEWDIHASSACKPTFVYRAGTPYKFTTYFHFFDTAQSTDFSLKYTNEITLVNAAYHEFGNVTRNELHLVNVFNGDGLFSGLSVPPIKTLQYDRTYKLKKRLTSTAKGYPFPTQPKLTVQWFLDGEFLIGYSNWAHGIGTSWVNCSNSYARFLHCGDLWFDGYVDPYSLYRSDPSSSVWIDNFKFDAIPK